MKRVLLSWSSHALGIHALPHLRGGAVGASLHLLPLHHVVQLRDVATPL